jgi:hypothetical protein
MKLRLIGALFVLAACSSSTDSGPAPPTSESLFDPALPPASPNKLRGVWSQGGVQTQAAGTIEVRYRFLEKYVVGAVKCVPASGGGEVIAGKTIALDTTDLDAASGKLSMGALVMDKKTDTFQCVGGNPNSGTFDFKITDNKISLTVAGAVGSIDLIKVND